ncbi:MAG: ester cyclase [Pseudomonadota bacterium]
MHIYLTKIAAQGELDLIDRFFHPELIDEAAIAFGGPEGIKGLYGHVIGFRRNIGNATIGIQNIIGNEAQVMAQWSFTGTHDGPWLNQAPTNKPISGTVFSYFTLSEGLVIRYRLWLCARFEDLIVFDSSKPLPENLKPKQK